MTTLPWLRLFSVWINDLACNHSTHQLTGQRLRKIRILSGCRIVRLRPHAHLWSPRAKSHGSSRFRDPPSSFVPVFSSNLNPAAWFDAATTPLCSCLVANNPPARLRPSLLYRRNPGDPGCCLKGALCWAVSRKALPWVAGCFGDGAPNKARCLESHSKTQSSQLLMVRRRASLGTTLAEKMQASVVRTATFMS